MTMPRFIPGLELSRHFYHEAVRPILNEQYPNLAHAAANIGTGSDVLGFDTPMSRDHDWGPSVILFLRDADMEHAASIRTVMRDRLPHMFYGYPVNFGTAPTEPETAVLQPTTAGPINHHVFVTTVRSFVQRHLGHSLDQPFDAVDWLTFPAQTLRGLTTGALYHDGVGELTTIREQLAWYPHDVWLYLLAAGWNRLEQEEHLMPRAGEVGDELGSAVIGSRLVRDIMTLCFLMERQYAPYPKWFGTAFKHLRCADRLLQVLWRAQQAATWPEREAALSEAYEALARMHNALHLTSPLPAHVSPFFGRPFKVIHGDLFAAALVAQIVDPQVQRIAAQRLIGGIDQWSDSTDLRSDVVWRPVLRRLYEINHDA